MIGSTIIHVKYDHFRQDRRDRWEELWVYRSYERERHNLPLIVLHAGFGVWYPGASYQRSSSDVFSVEYVLHGTIELTQRDRTTRIGAGEIFVLHRGVDHRYVAVGDSPAIKRYVCLDGPILEHTLYVLNLSGRDHIVPDRREETRSFFRRFPRVLGGSGPTIARVAGTLGYDLLQEIAGSVRLEYPEPIEIALSYMYSHLDRKVSVSELAGVVGLSEPYLNRLFRRYVRSSPIRFFNLQKLSWAAHLLLYTSLSIKEIAFRTGYPDPLYFSSQFKRYYKVSPRAYRRRPVEHPEVPQP